MAWRDFRAPSCESVMWIKRLKTYLLATRPQFLPAVAVPVALGASTAWASHRMFNVFYFTVSLIAALLYHAGMNVLNDYFDNRNGADNMNMGGLAPFTGGSRFIQTGLMTPRETLRLGALLIAGGSGAGLYLAYMAGMPLLIIGAAGLFSGVFYSAPPFFFAGRGLGEIIVGLNFGVMTVAGSHFVQAGEVSLMPVIASLPVSFFISALLYMNEFPDCPADRAAGKKTLVVLIGPEKGRYVIIALVGGAYLSLFAGIASG
ncbi:MAG: prenyltransferase, partial [Deltaproteobacteria bacterium]|nr:prenyltransferase [Deltaproteobacteria bacterium]